MWQCDEDVPECRIVFDLEWVGDSRTPSDTHITQVAAVNLCSGQTFSHHVRPLVANTACVGNRTGTVLEEWMAWIDAQCLGKPVAIIAHNGIRFDAPVLRNALTKLGIAIPPNIFVMDSLLHSRHHLKHYNMKGYSIDVLCAGLGIAVDYKNRHDAMYDVKVLCDILWAIKERCDCPVISGAAQPLGEISTMLVRGVGPSVWAAMPTKSLLSLCEAVLDGYNDLTTASCLAYLEESNLRAAVPLVDLHIIAENIEQAAVRYLQYHY